MQYWWLGSSIWVCSNRNSSDVHPPNSTHFSMYGRTSWLRSAFSFSVNVRLNVRLVGGLDWKESRTLFLDDSALMASIRVVSHTQGLALQLSLSLPKSSHFQMHLISKFQTPFKWGAYTSRRLHSLIPLNYHQSPPWTTKGCSAEIEVELCNLPCLVHLPKRLLVDLV